MNRRDFIRYTVGGATAIVLAVHMEPLLCPEVIPNIHNWAINTTSFSWANTILREEYEAGLWEHLNADSSFLGSFTSARQCAKVRS